MASNVYQNTTVRINFQQTTPATTWNIYHGLGTNCPVVDCYILESGTYTKFFPEHVYVVDTNNVQLVFGENQSGYATVM